MTTTIDHTYRYGVASEFSQAGAGGGRWRSSWSSPTATPCSSGILLETVIADIPTKESGAFLELLHELCVSLDFPVHDPACWNFCALNK